MKKYALMIATVGLFVAGCSKNDDNAVTGQGSSSTTQSGSGASTTDNSMTDTNGVSSGRLHRSQSIPIGASTSTDLSTNPTSITTPSVPDTSTPTGAPHATGTQTDTNSTGNATTQPYNPSTGSTTPESSSK